MTLLLGMLIIVAAVAATLRRVDVRLTLLLAAFALASVAGDPLPVLRTFFVTLVDEKFVVPICCAMGFAHVLKQTGCDEHLVQLLVRPLRFAHGALIPGAVLVGFLVNVPVISQTSTAVAVGAVLVPLLLAARLSPITVGSAVLLGASAGGELFNPGAPELRSVVEGSLAAAKERDLSLVLTGADCVQRIAPLNLVQLAVATLTFWLISLRAEARGRDEQTDGTTEEAEQAPAFRVNPLKAAVPLLPLVLLFATSPAFALVKIPPTWLVGADKSASFDSRLIGAAMLVGVVAAALTSPSRVGKVAGAFFDGAGYAYTQIISLIVVARCFGEGISQLGLARVVGDLIQAAPGLLFPLAAISSLGFAVLSGSGMAATQSLFGFFAGPALDLGIDPARVGAVVSLAAAAGRTMSPVAAVALMSAALTRTDVLDLARRVALPLLLGVLAMLLVAVMLPT